MSIISITGLLKKFVSIFVISASLCAAGMADNISLNQQSSPASKAGPIDVGGRKQLFIDNKFIESSKNIELTMNPPHQTGEVLIEADQPWELEPTPGAVTEFKGGQATLIYFFHGLPRGRRVDSSPSCAAVSNCHGFEPEK